MTVKIYTKVDDPDNGDTVYSKNYYMHYDVFNYDWNQWNRHGTEPWLDSDDGNANYIETSGCEYKQKYFEFEDLPAEISAEKVTLFVKLRDPDGATTGQHLRCYIWSGSQWILGADWIYNVNTSWKLLSEDITSILDSETKIDNARVYFQKMTDGGHNIRITFCWLLVHDVRYEAPPYSDASTLESSEWNPEAGDATATANVTSGVLHVWTLSEIVTLNGSIAYAIAKLYQDVHVWEGINDITIYYNYSAKGLIKGLGLGFAEAGLEIYMKDSDGNKIWNKTLFEEMADFDNVISIDESDAQFVDPPVSIPSAGTYTICVCLAAASTVHGVGIGLCDFLTGGDGVQVSMIIYPNSPNAKLTVRTYGYFSGNEITDVALWIDGTPYFSPRVDHIVACGDHIVKAKSVFYRGDYKYTFLYWEIIDNWDNPITVSILEDTTLKAIYYENYVPNNGGGGCPFVCAWNGTQYVIDNNLLADSEASGGADVEDYYRLEQALAPKHDGYWFSWYSLQIREFENEHSYLDQVRLMAVDHESDVNVAVSRSGEILTFKNPYAPVSAIDNHGNSTLDLVGTVDDNYYRGHPGDYLLLDFGNVDVSHGAKLVLRADNEFKKEIECVHVQVYDATEGWMDVAVLRTRVIWATEIVDLSDYLPDADGELKVRLCFTGIHLIDYIGLDTTMQADVDLHHASLVAAVHSAEGWVLPELLFNDDSYAELVPDEEITLTVILPKQGSQTRTFIAYIEGHYYTLD